MLSRRSPLRHPLAEVTYTPMPHPFIPKRALIVASVVIVTTTACNSGSGTTVYAGGTLWNGTGIPPILDAVIIVSNGHVEAAGPPDAVSIPRGADVRRVDGRWIIPGLIDARAHMERWMAPVLLSQGVTAVRDAGGVMDSVMALRDDAILGGTLMPRLYVGGAAIDAAPAHAPDVGVSNASEARRAIDQLVLAEATYALISPKITPVLLQPLMDEANSLLLPVAAHLGKVDALTAAGAGVKMIEYLSGIVEASVPDPDPYFRAYSNYYAGWKMALQGWNRIDSARIDQTARALADAEIMITPTLHYYETFSRLGDQQYVASLDLSAAPADARDRWNITRLIRDARLTNRDFTTFRRSRPRQNLFVRRFRAAGGVVAAGSNAPETLMVPGAGLHAELAQLVRAGLSTKDALLAATREAARLLATDSIGRIDAGTVADFLVLTADPLEDIANTRAIDFVVFKGQRYSPGDFIR